MLLVKREVAEELLTKFWRLEHPQEAAKLSHHGKLRAHHKAINNTRFTEKGYPGNCRSIFGLPMFSETSRTYMRWSAFIILMDATYTSLWVPISAAFEAAHFITSPTGGLDFSMGLIFFFDLLMRFHMPIRLTGAFLGTTLHRGPIVARFYVFHGSFIVDFLAAVPLLVLPVVEGAERVVIFVLVLRILRLLRVQRIISMMSNIQVRRPPSSPAPRPRPQLNSAGHVVCCSAAPARRPPAVRRSASCTFGRVSGRPCCTARCRKQPPQHNPRQCQLCSACLTGVRSAAAPV